ncbi:MAG: hypothetical protein LBC87_05315 [Fibromonadaceae bacterium]|jgi:hypothetical protein|nr:hypothetical protein [Fibromonadaceae bacterium]
MLINNNIHLACIGSLLGVIFVFAQSPDPEMEFQRKYEAMQAECNRIALTVPCAVGIGEVDKLRVATDQAERDAIKKLALSVKAFVSYQASDSSYIDGRVSKELSSVVSKIEANISLSNTQTIKEEHVKLADSEGHYYRVIILKALGQNKSLYEEAEKKINMEKNEETEKKIDMEKTTLKVPSKADLKQIAAKTATLLLGIAKKAVGLP